MFIPINKKANKDVIKYPVLYLSLKGKDFEEARTDFDYKVPLKDFSGAIRSVAFCREYAKEKGIESYINRMSLILKNQR